LGECVSTPIIVSIGLWGESDNINVGKLLRLDGSCFYQV
jgi:hypothetical protein